MSHQKLRIEKNCLNCGHSVEDRYCSHCGQENVEIRDSTAHYILHYLQDLFHYDGRVWHTIRNLLLKPGQVAIEYLDGKRRHNVEPIRLYVFASSVFFLFLFFRLSSIDLSTADEHEVTYSKRMFFLLEEKKRVAGTPDTVYVNRLIQSLSRSGADTVALNLPDTIKNNLQLDVFDPKPDSTAYEPGFWGWLQQRIDLKAEELKREHEGDDVEATTAFLDEVYHKLPQLLFLSMPFFALLLKLLYWRNPRRRFVEHFIFSTYHYAFLFLLMAFYLLLHYAMDKAHLPAEGWWLDAAKAFAIFYPFTYLFLAMKRFYQDGPGKLLLRYLTLLFLSLVMILILFLLIAFITFLF